MHKMKQLSHTSFCCCCFSVLSWNGRCLCRVVTTAERANERVSTMALWNTFAHTVARIIYIGLICLWQNKYLCFLNFSTARCMRRARRRDRTRRGSAHGKGGFFGAVHQRVRHGAWVGGGRRAWQRMREAESEAGGLNDIWWVMHHFAHHSCDVSANTRKRFLRSVVWIKCKFDERKIKRNGATAERTGDEWQRKAAQNRANRRGKREWAKKGSDERWGRTWGGRII